jgi:hypothetical protein
MIRGMAAGWSTERLPGGFAAARPVVGPSASLGTLSTVGNYARSKERVGGLSDHLCECGCGGYTTLIVESNARQGRIAGEPNQYIRGHHHAKRYPTGLSSELCRCGCGERTRYGARGVPNGYVVGHNYRGHRLGWVEDPETGCWISDYATPYGRIEAERKTQHRVAYEAANGAVPEGHEVHHECENKRCVNPAHLVALTPAEHKWRHAKLTREAVREIRRRLVNAPRGTGRALSREFGITEGHVSAIKHETTWVGA